MWVYNSSLFIKAQKTPTGITYNISTVDTILRCQIILSYAEHVVLRFGILNNNNTEFTSSLIELKTSAVLKRYGHTSASYPSVVACGQMIFTPRPRWKKDYDEVLPRNMTLPTRQSDNIASVVFKRNREWDDAVQCGLRTCVSVFLSFVTYQSLQKMTLVI